MIERLPTRGASAPPPVHGPVPEGGALPAAGARLWSTGIMPALHATLLRRAPALTKASVNGLAALVWGGLS